jgi:UDP:flavonoid glycosyltransferase YjiC (YdhE family)
LGNGADDEVEVVRTRLPSRTSNPWDYWRSHELSEELFEADFEMLADQRPDVVVVDGRFTTIIAAELLSIPVFSVVKACTIPGQRYHARDNYWEAMFSPMSAILDTHHGRPLKADTRELFVRNQIICPSIPEFEQLPVLPDTARVHYTGPIVWEPRTGYLVEYDLDKSRDIAVYGAVLVADDLELLAASFRGTGYRLVIASPERGVAEVVKSFEPSEVVSIPYLSFEKELYRFAGAITHAGHGSCLSALLTGTATVLLPNAGQMEQHDNATRMQHLGVGVAVHSRADWHTVGRAFTSIIRSDTVRERLRELSERSRRYRGAEDVVTQIEVCLEDDPFGHAPSRWERNR